MTTKEIRTKLENENSVNTFSVKNGVYTVKKSYFWGVAQSGESFATKIKIALPTAKIIDYGNHFHNFVGGAKAGSSKDSYFWVKFTV